MRRRRYGGDDKNVGSGRLELRYHDGSESYIDDGFLMENTGVPTSRRLVCLTLYLSDCIIMPGYACAEQEGNGPESMLEFIKACRGLPYKNGADQNVGLQAVRVLDAMYRSAASKKTEKAK